MGPQFNMTDVLIKVGHVKIDHMKTPHDENTT